VAEAEDLTQETFVKVWRNLDKFDQTRSFRNWLLTIAQNTSLDYLKKKKSVPFSQFETENGDNQLIDGLADKTPLVSQVLENRDKIDWLVGSLPELSEKSRQIINLHHDKELTFREIAEQLDEPINTVKSRYRRALIDLKNIFENS
jgi:RNA polymerase sigma-70 factor (ECF subfamily)